MFKQVDVEAILPYDPKFSSPLFQTHQLFFSDSSLVLLKMENVLNFWVTFLYYVIWIELFLNSD